jgi:Transglutaminase-like superfamily
MNTVDGYARQSPYSDPGRYTPLLDGLPTDVGELAAVARNVIVHYWASGLTFTDERLAETDQRRNTAPLRAPRPDTERIAGCCRDFTLLTVAALRHQGVPARSRVGFAGYLDPTFHYDHVVVDYWNGERWVYVDAMLDPAQWPFDPADIPRPVGARPEPPLFATAAQVWSAYRAGTDVDSYGVGPDLPLRGGWFVGAYVLQELAHRQREELLLWDVWGAMPGPSGDGDTELIDEVAALLLRADEGDAAAEEELADRYCTDPRLHPGETVRCMSPTGTESVVDLRSRAAAG